MAGALICFTIQLFIISFLEIYWITSGLTILGLKNNESYMNIFLLS